MGVVRVTTIGRLSAWILITALVVMPAHAEEFNIPDDYETVERALADLKAKGSSGDTLVLSRGTHTANVILDFPVTIRGEETIATVVEGDSASGTAFRIIGTRNVIIKNITFSNADEGIRVVASGSVSIVNNVFNLGSEGVAITVEDGSPVNIANNVFYDNKTGVSRVNAETVIKNNAFVNQNTAIVSVGILAGVSFNGYYNNDRDGVKGINWVADSDPLFVSTSLSDFHLREGSPYIDAGDGTDVIDDTDADIGAYGGSDADVRPAIVRTIIATDATAAAGTSSIDVGWSPNLSYLVTNSSSPGHYQVYYDSDAPGSPYDGTDAGGGTLASPINVGSVTLYRLENLSPSQELPAAPTITNVEPGDGRMTVRWSAVADATGYNVYYGVDDVGENTFSPGQVTSATITGLINGQAYKFAVSAWFQSRYYVNVTAVDNTGEDDRESDYGAEAVVTMGDVLESARSEEVSAIPEVAQPFPDLPNEGCFVATAAFGGTDAPAVLLLRSFRDRYLKSTIVGRWFVHAYYRYGPALASQIRRDETLRSVARAALTPLVAVAAAMTRYPYAVVAVLMLWGFRRYSRHRVRL